AALELAGDVQRHQTGVEIRLFDFLYLDLDLLAGQFFEALAQLLDAVALTTDHDAGLRGVERHLNLVRVALDLDAANPYALGFLLHVLTDAEVFVQQLGVAVAFRVPARGPDADDLQTETNRVYFSTHSLIYSSSRSLKTTVRCVKRLTRGL